MDGGSHNNKVLLSPKALKLALIRRERRSRVSVRIHAAAMADRAGFIRATIRPLTEKKKKKEKEEHSLPGEEEMVYGSFFISLEKRGKKVKPGRR